MNAKHHLNSDRVLERPDTGLRRPRRGFSVLEVSIVAALSGFLFLMISSVWVGFGRSLADSIAQAKVVSESEMALHTIRRDFRGSLPGTEQGRRDAGLLVGMLVSGSDQVLLCYDSDSPNGVADWAAPDRVVRYELTGGQLLRVDQTTGNVFVVANHVQDFQVTKLANSTRIVLGLAYRDFARQYILHIQYP